MERVRGCMRVLAAFWGRVVALGGYFSVFRTDSGRGSAALVEDQALEVIRQIGQDYLRGCPHDPR